MSFEDLGLAPTILSALSEAGFTEPTSVQAAAIPQAMAGADLMVSSQTGSGKTAAFKPAGSWLMARLRRASWWC